MRHVPAASAPQRLTAGLPAAAKRLTWAESVAFGRYTALPLARGTRIRLTDTDGDACVHVLLYRSGMLHERLNVADTVKVPWQAYPTAGHPLLSDAGRLMGTIVADTSARHDALTGTTTLAGNTSRYGAGTVHSGSPAGRELLTLAALKQGLGARDVAPSLSLFKGIRVDPDGSIQFTGGAGAGAAVEILLQMDAVVLLANTAHPLDPRPEFTGTAVDVVAWHAPEDLRLAGGRDPRGAAQSRAPAGPEQHRTRPHRKERTMTTTNTLTAPAASASEAALAAGAVVLDEYVEARGPWSAVVAAGDVLTIVDLEGNQAVDCLLYAADDTDVRYSAADTIAEQRSIVLTTGSVLRVRRRRAADDRGRRTRWACTTPSAGPARRSPTPCATASTPANSTPAWRTS